MLHAIVASNNVPAFAYSYIDGDGFTMRVLGFFVGAIPLVIACIAATHHLPWLMLLSVALLFVVVGVLPLARHRENISMFVLVFFTTIPLNISAVQWLLGLELINATGYRIGRLLFAVSSYNVLLTTEELILGILTRIIWPRQYKTYFTS